jgi:predicted deacylase
MELPAEVLHGARPGPTVFLSGAIHGDEIVGVEIIRQLLEQIDERTMGGTLIALPVVNVFGFVAESRYLPDRRDLNRSFPGSPRGSLASRLARIFVDEVLSKSDFGIDFHAGSDDRTNLPQIRGNLEDDETRRLAHAFAPPLIVHSKTIGGSLRDAARKLGKRTLLFEGGEPRRFSPRAVSAGVAGGLRTLAALDMLETAPESLAAPVESRSTHWVRAPRGGIFRLGVKLGSKVSKGDLLGIISGPIGRDAREITATVSGIVMGHAVNPLVHQGDGLVHLAESE